jgi:hypothetical protein
MISPKLRFFIARCIDAEESIVVLDNGRVAINYREKDLFDQLTPDLIAEISKVLGEGCFEHQELAAFLTEAAATRH